jgi:hypothetical protein
MSSQIRSIRKHLDINAVFRALQKSDNWRHQIKFLSRRKKRFALDSLARTDLAEFNNNVGQ